MCIRDSPLTDKIGQNVADFLAADMKRGIIPSSFLPLQSGVGLSLIHIFSKCVHKLINYAQKIMSRQFDLPITPTDVAEDVYKRQDVERSYPRVT